MVLDFRFQDPKSTDSLFKETILKMFPDTLKEFWSV